MKTSLIKKLFDIYYAYNVFCYADDLIIASLSVTGLQEMLHVTPSYIVDHGLNLNPAKTTCKTFGISSLRFHNGLTHFLAFRDNQEKLNYRAIRQEILIIIVLLTCIGTKIKRCTKLKVKVIHNVWCVS